MTKANKTSSRLRKPGVYVDQSNLQKESNVAYVKQVRARKFAAIRAGNKQGNNNKSTVAKDESENEEMSEDGGNSEHENASRISAGGRTLGKDGFTVTHLTPYRETDSSTLATTTISSLSDEKVLGCALYEWLLPKEDWDCHTLWEKFLVDWEPITETERPPGTNRPLNLHGYLTYLKSTNNKRVVRQDIREARETLRMEREAHVRDHADDDPLAVLNLQALNGPLLQYYLKIKNLIPYESKTQQRKKDHADRKRKAEMEGPGPTPEAAEGEEPTPNEIIEHEPVQPKKKKAKQSHPPAAAAASSRPTAGSLKLGQASCFAALLDCD